MESANSWSMVASGCARKVQSAGRVIGLIELRCDRVCHDGRIVSAQSGRRVEEYTCRQLLDFQRSNARNRANPLEYSGRQRILSPGYALVLRPEDLSAARRAIDALAIVTINGDRHHRALR